MKDSLILQDKIYISAKRVHEIFGYTSDYVGQLCRAGKLDAKMIGRSWFVTEKSVIDHKTAALEVINPKLKNSKTEEKIVFTDSVKTALETKTPARKFSLGFAGIIGGLIVFFVVLASVFYVGGKGEGKITSFTKVSQEAVVSLPSFNGLAVAPATQSIEGDELLKKKISDSFSDEVEVSPSDDKTSGVITPIFRERKGDDFLYVMVPVDESP